MSIKPPSATSPLSAPLDGVDLPEPAHVRPVKPVPRPNLPKTGVNTRELAKMLGRAAREGASPIVMAVPDVSDALTLDPTGDVEVVDERAPPTNPGPPPTFSVQPPPALPSAAFDAEAARVRVAGEATTPEAASAPANDGVARVRVAPVASSALPMAARGPGGGASQPSPSSPAPSSPAPSSPAPSSPAPNEAPPTSRIAAPPPRRSMSAAEALERARVVEGAAPVAAPAAAPPAPVPVVPAAAPVPAAPAAARRQNPGETTRPRPRKPVADAPAAPPPGTPGRAMASAPPPRRVLTAAEALAAARVTEPASVPASAAAAASGAPSVAAPAPAAPPAAAPPAPPPAAPPSASTVRTSAARPAGGPSPVRAAQALLGVLLPETQPYVAAAVMVQDTALLRPLWKAHRARLASAHAGEHALAAAAVVSALATRADALSFALVVLDERELLVAIDLEERSLVAVLPDARSWGVPWDA
jgi:hypothetical protein